MGKSYQKKKKTANTIFNPHKYFFLHFSVGHRSHCLMRNNA